MANTNHPSIDHTSHLKTECSELKTPSPTASSRCTPRCCRQALASLDRNTPVSNLKLEYGAFKTPSPANSCCTPHRHRRRQALVSLDRSTPVNPPSSSSTTKTKYLQTPRTKSPSNKKKEKENQHEQNIPIPVLFCSPPALERLQHDLANRRRPYDDSEGDEYYARRRANVSRMRELREKARRLVKTIRKTRRVVDEGIQRLSGGSPAMSRKGVAGFGISDSWGLCGYHLGDKTANRGEIKRA